MNRVMRRVVLLIVLALLASVGWSQTMTINFKNGMVVDYEMDDIASIIFKESDNSTSDFLNFTLDGKTYSAKVKYYAQVAPIDKDENGKSLTYTYGIEDLFNIEGFLFRLGLIHFSWKSDLLASPIGTYYCSERPHSGDYKHNLTLCPNLKLNFNTYKWSSGTHEVKSIKEVNGKVQIEGDFTSTFYYDGDSRTVEGNYRMTIPD